jgi:hypothetical protein
MTIGSIACTPASSAAAAKRPRILIDVQQAIQEDGRCWQELGVETPRLLVKERLGSVLGGATRGKSVGQQQRKLEPEDVLE